ncbi:hypothetical protein ADIS_2631 [Lunatimonas lonarensis]|uniref:Outer membrane protein beta-barrel domain-containing protein n=1 Tax=Lunatimonas lonarensis TaxID=1232681 RepID=R7ZRZ4_9BACT|nr:hypothetical protein [Lunatimonas lonarensis]EON76885.1 hypothetical protein ADIS_2631 [Lunatimonas lonarensis]
MNRIILIILLIWGSVPKLYAQEAPETLFGNKLSISNFGVFVDPGFQATQIAGESAGFFLFRGGIVVNDKWSLGGFYGQMIQDIRPASFDNLLPPQAHMDSYQAGGFIEYTLLSSKVVHLTFPLALGMMELEIDEEGRNFDYEEAKTFFVEPGAQIEVNLHRFARLHAGLGYRMMGAMIQNSPGVPETGSNLTLQVGLKMGVFNFRQLK